MQKEKTKIFKALSDLNRLRILKALQTRSMCVCEIKLMLALANSTVSQHLKVLKESGFILEKKEGKWVNYMINPRPGDERISAILSSLDFWINDEAVIIKDKNTIRKLDRNTICSV
ncbi:MAG: winged helix-turn-helix transcriptional regulator [Melioribacteraceae bacterium]|nr:winged helix-turn-helix transcriptional regulator [Melioribacteraceae bacterium]